jgi:hypothetical protein
LEIKNRKLAAISLKSKRVMLIKLSRILMNHQFYWMQASFERIKNNRGIIVLLGVAVINNNNKISLNRYP